MHSRGHADSEYVSHEVEDRIDVEIVGKKHPHALTNVLYFIY